MAIIKYEIKDITHNAYNKLPLESTPCKITLEEHGVRWLGDGFLVANSHPGIRKVFQGSLWAEGAWISALSRVEGAEKRKQQRFSGGVRSLCVYIPSKHITEDYIKSDLGIDEKMCQSQRHVTS